jgi:hypothetical protein
MEQSYEQIMVNQIFSVQYKFDNVLGEVITNVFNLYDIDGDGHLDYDDYVSFISDLMYVSILMKRMKNVQYNIDNVLHFAKWTAKNISDQLFNGTIQLLPFEVFSKKIIYALTEYNSSPISDNDMHFSSLLPEFMNFFNYYVQLSHRRGWPSLLNLGENENTHIQHQSHSQQEPPQPPQPPQEINEQNADIPQNEEINSANITEQPEHQQPQHIPFGDIDQFNIPDAIPIEIPTLLPPEPPHELEIKEGVVIPVDTMGYDMIEGDLNINQYIHSNKEDNIAFKVGENYYLTNKSIIRTMINLGEKDNALYYGCSCEIKDDWTRAETWAMLDRVVVNNPIYFHIQHLGLPIRYVLFKDILAVLDNNETQIFCVEKSNDPVFIPSFASDNVLNHGIGSMSGVHCQDGQSDTIYQIKKIKPRFSMF